MTIKSLYEKNNTNALNSLVSLRNIEERKRLLGYSFINGVWKQAVSYTNMSQQRCYSQRRSLKEGKRIDVIRKVSKSKVWLTEFANALNNLVSLRNTGEKTGAGGILL